MVWQSYLISILDNVYCGKEKYPTEPRSPTRLNGGAKSSGKFQTQLLGIEFWK